MSIQTKTMPTVENEVTGKAALTYEEKYAKYLEYFGQLSAIELLVYRMCWKQGLFPDEIATRLHTSCEEIVQEITIIARKMAPIADLL